MPNIIGAGGAASNSNSSPSLTKCRAVGSSRSLNFAPSEPFSIFSKPIASAQSASPPRIERAAPYSAVEPVEQLLLTL